MASDKRKPKSVNGRQNHEVQRLKRENRELRKRLKAVEMDYRRVVHAWAKDQFTEDDIKEWKQLYKQWTEGTLQTGSLPELINELEKSHKRR